MQTSVSVNYMNNLKQAVALRGKARLIAEWNHNRFAGPAEVVCTNYPDSDSDEFPIESVVAPYRPSKNGILKARGADVTKWRQTKDIVEGYVQSKYDDSSTAAGKRSYTVSKESKYKYWASPTTSSVNLVGGSYALNSGSLEVTYTKDIWTNKVVAVFESGVVVPKNINVFYKTTVAGAWTSWGTNYQVDANGRLELYRQSNGSMTSTQNFTSPTKIRGIKVVVGGLSASTATLGVIEVSARLELDLSDFIVDYRANNSISEHSLVAPMGVCSSNEASVTLDNTDGRFDNDRATLRGTNVENILYGLVDKNIRMRMDIGIETNGTFEYVRQFTMWADEVSGQNEPTSEFSLKDSSKILQEQKPNAALYQDVTTAGAVWRMCDSVGFNDYIINTAALNDNHIMNFFWTDPETSVWEHFQKIAEATQTAIYFDEYDNLLIMPRSAAYDLTKPTSWTFDAVPVGNTAVAQGRPSNDNNKIADIKEVTQSYDFEANVVNVTYTPTNVSEMVGTTPKMERVWEPEGDVVLRASRLIQSISESDRYMRITAKEAELWPYSGTVQMEGEFIKYIKKGYTYRDAADKWVSTYISSAEEKKKLDDLNPRLSFMNYFNGYFDILGGRGQWGSVAKAHYVDVAGYSGRYRTLGGAIKTWSAGITHNANNGTLQMVTNKTFSPNAWYVASRGSSNDVAPIYYGTRLRFPTSGYGYGAAGLATNLGSNDSGYFVEVLRTVAITANDRAKYTNELVFYKRNVDGSIVRYGPNGGKGIPVEIIAGKWYDLDVKIFVENGYHTVYIILNGSTQMTVTVPGGQGLPLVGRYGMFTRGWTSCEFEYLYASTAAVQDTLDQPGWFDQILGGYQSSQSQREWIYGQRTQRVFRSNKQPLDVIQRFDSLLFDEFGPVVHEVREYDVKFSKFPVIHSNLYISNDRQIICPEYNGNAFGAKFVLANTARVRAMANGEDTLTLGDGSPVEHNLLVYGRLVETKEEKKYTVRNEAAVNRRGAAELDISSEWIQSESAAKSIGDWITSHWGGGTDEVTLSSTGNPLLQLGDIVSINYPNKNMKHATHKYFVVSINHTFDGSLSTELILRRAKL